MKSLLLILFIFLLPLTKTSAQEKSEAENKTFKPGNAVTEFNKEDGFKLTERAVKNLGVKFKGLKGNGPWSIPKDSLVRIKHSVGVYRKYEDWITMVLVKVISRTKDQVQITSVDLQNGDAIATSGVLYLRLTEADLNSDTVDACAH